MHQHKQQQDAWLLVEAVKENNLPWIEELLGQGVSTNARDVDRNTSLYWACCHGYVGVCRRLLRRQDCDVNAQGKAGATALMACADNGQEACLSLLLQHRSICMDTQSERGDTALHMAAYRGFKSIVSLLCQAGANTDLRNNNGKTALAEAFIHGHSECASFLNRFVQSKLRTNKSDAPTREPLTQSVHSNPRIVADTKKHSSLPAVETVRNGFSWNKEENLPFYSSPEESLTTYRKPECADERQIMSSSDTKTCTDDQSIITNPLSDVNLLNSVYKEDNITYSGSVSDSSTSISGSMKSDKFMFQRQDSGVICSGQKAPATVQARTRNDSVDFNSSTISIGHAHPASIDSQYLSSSNSDFSMDPPCSPPAIYSYHPSVRSKPTKSVYSSEKPLPLNIPVVGKYQKYHVDHDCVRKSLHNEEMKNNKTIAQTDFSVGGLTITSGSVIDGEKRQPEITEINSRKDVSDKGRDGIVRPSGAGCDRETLAELKVSAFIENLQIRILKLEEALDQERASKRDMRQEIVWLREENKKLRDAVKDQNNKSQGGI